MTHRQFAAWDAWLKAQWNVPARSDWYAMQVAAEVKAVLGKRPDLASLKLSFGEAERKPQTRQEVTEKAKTQWSGILGSGSGEAVTEGQQRLRELVLSKRPDLRKG